jgi:hypothetical protein
MKHYTKYIFGMAAAVGITASSCKKDFFNRPPESGVTVGNYYQTSDQVRASTNGLYGLAGITKQGGLLPNYQVETGVLIHLMWLPF